VPRDPLKEFKKLVGVASQRVVILAPSQRLRTKKGKTSAPEEPGA